MQVMPSPAPFGTATRTRALVALALLGSSYPRELARMLGQALSVVQKALVSLERDDLVVAQSVGRTRLYRLNPRYFAKPELEAFLAKLAKLYPDVTDSVAAVRRRARRTGKPL